MNVPPSAGMFKEAAARGQRELAPDALGEGPDAVHYAAPIATLCDMGINERPEPGQEMTCAGAEGNVGFIDAHCIDTAMGLRHHPPPRHRDDGAAMPVGQQRQDIINRCQAGAKNQDRCVPVYARRGWRRPRIGLAGNPQCGRIMPRRENSDVAGQMPAICERHRDTVGALPHIATFALNDGEAARSACPRKKRLDQTCNVVAIEAARNKAERIGTEVLLGAVLG